ncbi:MAG TPA: fasciclin domain-containing protein [Flavipsychrobacter sp.]|nr:fasciclin domain-containing protein [Flavipsychrobacter sp.]
MKKQFFVFAAFTALTFSLVSCQESSSTTDDTSVKDTVVEPAAAPQEEGVVVGGAMMVPSKDIVDNAMGSGEHTTLVAAVKQAGLVETLKGAGPYTVFAPTNAAFDEIPKATLDGLMKDENKDKLKNILTYHVVAGSLRATDLTDGQKLKTVQGKDLTVKVQDGKVWINNAEVTIPNVVSSNGVTHVINKVLMP